MGSRQPSGLFAWLKSKFFPSAAPESELVRARKLIVAIDRGGIPLNTAKVNAIARDLGLEVSRNAPLEETLQRIRRAVERAASHD